MTQRFPTGQTLSPGVGTRKRQRVGSVVGAGAVLASSVLGAYVARMQRAYAATVCSGSIVDESSLGLAITALNDPGNACDTLSFGADVTLSAAPGVLSADKNLTIDGNGYTVDGNDTHRPFKVNLSEGRQVLVSSITVEDGVAPTVNGYPENAGALYVMRGDLVVEDSVFSGNRGLNGGAIFTYSGVEATIARTVFSDNAADLWGQGAGGALFVSGATTVTDSAFSGNAANSRGGAISSQGRDTVLEVTGSTLSNNSAGQRGGGIGVFDGVVRVLNSTLTGNSSDVGGALSLDNRSDGSSIAFSTITANTAVRTGGGIYSYSDNASTVSISNSLVQRNTAPSAPDAYGNPLYQNCYYSPCTNYGPTLFDVTYTVTTAANSINQIDESVGLVFTADPVVAALADNGGVVLPTGQPALTMLPLADSVARDSANPNTVGFPLTDQRGPGFPRVVGGRADIGAVEVAEQSSAPLPPRNVTARAGVRSAVVQWDTPASPGSEPITTYTVTSAPDGKSCTAVAPQRRCEVTGLRGGVPYTFTVTASNSVGTSVPSASSSSVRPTAPPSRPGRLQGEGRPGLITLRWTEASPGAQPITGYIARCVYGSKIVVSRVPGRVTKVALRTVGTWTYRCRVVATTGAGRGAVAGPIEVSTQDR